MLRLFLLAQSATFAWAGPIVQTKYGPIEGKVIGDATAFLGVPFAAPPIGENRLRAPQAPKSWTDVLPCLENKPRCPQLDFVGTGFQGDEDCLYVDVWVPTKSTNESLPVMQWIYGGGFFEGSINVRGYNGSQLAAKYNVIVVEANYRVGSLGFIALEQAKAESPVASTGNYGMQDQTAAMRWTRDNIQAFGGDASRVTLFGQSAGAMSVAFHLASPGSAGLFHRAIVESGSGDVPMFFSSYNRTRSFSEDFLRGVGCDSQTQSDLLGCARKLTTKQILGDVLLSHAKGPGFRPALNPVMPWAITLDNTTEGLTLRPVDTINNGTWNRVPVIIGSNANEGSIFVPVLAVTAQVGLPLNDRTANETFLHVFGGNVTVLDAVIQQYPTKAFPNNDDRASTISRDYVFGCGLRRLARAISNARENAYLYHFTFLDDREVEKYLGVFHAAELTYVFGNPPNNTVFTPREQNMSSTFGQLWTSFARTGVPSSEFTPAWTPYSSAADPIMKLDLPAVLESGYLSQQCEFWDRLAAWNNPDV